MNIEMISKEPFIIVVRGFLSHELCDTIISKAESEGFVRAGVKSPDLKENKRTDLRNNGRANFADGMLFQELKKRLFIDLDDVVDLVEVFPEPTTGVSLIHKVYKYVPDEEFKFHNDMQEPAGSLHTTHATVLIGLSDGYEGGETEFKNADFGKVKLAKGDMLIFEQMPEIYDDTTRHRGCAVTSGTKYIYRTDLLKKRTWLIAEKDST